MSNKPDGPQLLQALDDWVECMPVALKAAFSEPALFAAALILCVALVVIPVTRAYVAHHFIAQTIYQFCAAGLACKAILFQDQLMNANAGEAKLSLGMIGRAFINSVLYNVVAIVAGLFFLIPGVMFAIRAALSLQAIVLEEDGVIAAFFRSIELTDGRFLRTLIYMVCPTIACLAFNFVPGGVIIGLEPAVLKDQASPTWVAEHPSFAAILFVCAVILLFVQISIAPLLTKLYVEYTEEPAATSED